jgi:hypothetical protein
LDWKWFKVDETDLPHPLLPNLFDEDGWHFKNLQSIPLRTYFDASINPFPD